ncbi:hypothetical protein ACPCAG_28140 [Streptomyces pseudogriseolus]|uniref:hypothetical protein n=1 Tax=Streptomyces pseudogriseolus TaxID=36817 RepID=UPI003FA330F8
MGRPGRALVREWACARSDQGRPLKKHSSADWAGIQFGEIELAFIRIYTDPIGHPFCLCRNKGVVWTGQGPVRPGRD